MTKESQYLPDCWDDDERMGYLFSEFRGNKQVNPRDWDNKQKFWSDVVISMGRVDRTLIFSSRDLPQRFRRKGVVPLCLDGVLREMYRAGQIERVDDLKADATWSSWGVNTLIRRPWRWSMNRLFKQSEAPPPGEYVAVELLQEFGEAILERHHQSVKCSSTDHVVDYSTFKKECADLCREEASFDLVLLYLQRRKEALVTADENTKVIKFAARGAKIVLPVTSTELGTLRLKKTIASMQASAERLALTIEQEGRETRQYLRKGMKSSAKKALRRKKLAQQRLERSETTLYTLQHLQDKLQAAESEKMILDAYRTGAEALKRTFADNGLTPEAVDDTISDVQEVMEMCNEIDDTIIQGNKSVDDTINFGMEAELDALEMELEALLGGEGDTSLTTSSLAKDDTGVTTPSLSQDDTGVSEDDAESPTVLSLPDVPAGPPGVPSRSVQEGSRSGERELAS